MARIYVSGLFHETHCFVDETTGLTDFEIKSGAELLDCLGDSSPLGGALQTLQSAGHQLVAGTDFRALPGGQVEDEVIEHYWSRVLATWQDNVDGIFLVLHGAMVSQSMLDVEGEILRRFRSLAKSPSLPIVGVYDLHANFSDSMARFADGLVGYRCNPHTDARDSAIRAAELLDWSLSERSRISIVHRAAGRLWTPAATGTADEPMRTLETLARRWEDSSQSILAVNVTAGFAFADTPDTGVSFQVVTTDRSEAEGVLDELVEQAHRLDARASPTDRPLDEVLSLLTANPIDGLTVLVEASDNIGGGAPGDVTRALRGLLEHQISRAAICINDPIAVKQLQSRSPGSRVTTSIGGRGSRYDAGPVTLEVEVVSSSDGRFELIDKHSHLASMSGDTFDMGDCVVVRHAGLVILLTSRKTPPFDLGQWTSQGIDLTAYKVVVAKAAVAHRAAYDPITERSFHIDTPGPCRSDLTQFDYRHVPPSYFKRL